MNFEKKTIPVNACAVAVNAWILEIEHAHLEIQQELHKIRGGIASQTQVRAMDQILALLRRLRSIAPSPRMITTWTNSDAALGWN